MRWCLALTVLFCCTPKDQSPAIVIWENGKAVAVSLLKDDSVYVEGSPYAMLGSVIHADDRSVFTPTVPFQRGQTYHTSAGVVFSIPTDTTLKTPRLLGSFPSCDTVPSNMLKMYLQFSEPMSEGRSYQHIRLFDVTTGDTVKNAFLDLQPELWNEDGRVLTLWLDPGRIKQDLIPNKKLGVVMNDHHQYRLHVSKGWRGRNGLELEQDYDRTIVTSDRDVKKPDIRNWTVSMNDDTVVIDLHESLDWSLIQSTVSIEHNESKTITMPCEKKLCLVPVKTLAAGSYTLKIESRLEDLAGNNLNRLFETDVTTSSKKSDVKDVYTIQFRVN